MSRSRRPYQIVALAVQQQRRIVGYFWARRCRKSTTAGDIYFHELAAGPNRTVINCSSSLLLGGEAIGMTRSAIEEAERLTDEAATVRECFEANAAEHNLHFRVADSSTGKEYKSRLTTEQFTNLYRERKCELRLYFSPTSYSRELILAPNVQTFRSYRALIGFDEFGYLPPAAAKELVDSADAMMRDTPDRRMLFFSNLSREENHPWFEMTMPRDFQNENEDDQFPANPEGHLYIGQTGILIHRVALKDAYAAGHQLFDDAGAPMDYESAKNLPTVRSAWDTNYALIHRAGGTCAVDMVALITAQQRGVGKCHFVFVTNDGEFEHALDLLASSLTDGQVGIGFDVATTTGDVSNPSAVTVRERVGGERFDRLKIVWKERQPQVARHRLERIVETVRRRPAGGGARRLCIDASNERYFATETADLFRHLIPTQLVIAGQTVTPRPAGYYEKDGEVNYKTWLGDLESATVNDGRLALPPDRYVKNDYRMVLKDRGRYVCTPDAITGAHGDLFDSGKLAEFALIGGSNREVFTHENVAEIRARMNVAPEKMKPRFVNPARQRGGWKKVHDEILR